MPDSSFNPTSWFPTPSTRGIKQPSVEVSYSYMFRKESQVQAHAGMLSSQATSPPIKNMSGCIFAAILLKFAAASVQPESPALIILIGLLLLSGRVRQTAFVQNWLSYCTLVRYFVSGFSPVISAEWTALSAFHSSPLYQYVSAVTLEKIVGSGVLSSWQQTVTFVTSLWVWIFRKNAQLGSYGTVAQTWQGAPGGQALESWNSLVQQVLMPNPKRWLQQPIYMLQKQRQVLYMKQFAAMVMRRQISNFFFEGLSSARQACRKLLSADAPCCCWSESLTLASSQSYTRISKFRMGPGLIQFLLPLSAYTIRVRMAIIPRTPSTRQST